MSFSAFCKYLKKLEQTDSRLEMVSILAGLINETSDKEVADICYLSLGRLGPLFDNPQFNIASKMMIRAIARASERPKEEITALFKERGDLGEVAGDLIAKKSPQKPRTITEIYHILLGIAREEGTGSQERKLRKIALLLRQADSTAARYLTRIILGTLRLGFSEITLLDALSKHLCGNKSSRDALERAFSVYPDIGHIAKLVKHGDLSALKEINLEIGVPFKSQLCQRVNNPAEIIERHHGFTAAEPKLDGTRVQLHFERDRPNLKIGASFVKTFTRNLEETTHQYPQIVENASKIKADSLILDGEALGIDAKTGAFLPFQKTITRKRKHNVDEAALQVKLIYVVFDLLYLNGDSLLDLPLRERRRRLSRIVKSISSVRSFKGGEIVVGDQWVISSDKKLKMYFEDYTGKGGEGLVCKDLEAPYKAGARGYSWIKFKNINGGSLSDTVDCLVMGIYKGRGKRAKFGVGAFLVGVLDKGSDQYRTIAKIGTGLKDEEWRKLSALTKKLRVEKCPKNYVVPKELTPDTWFFPRLVVSIRADNITKSPLHSAGVAFRFPRLMAWREDKPPSDSTTLKELIGVRP